MGCQTLSNSYNIHGECAEGYEAIKAHFEWMYKDGTDRNS